MPLKKTGSLADSLTALVGVIFWLAIGVMPFVLIFRGIEIGLLPQTIGLVLMVVVVVIEIWYFNKAHGPGP